MRTFMAILAVFTVLTLGCGDDDSGSDEGPCTMDSQCKGDRICIGGECVDPDSVGGMDGGPGGTGGTGTGGTGGTGLATCPNGTCDSGETCTNCPQDCGACAGLNCGDGVCSTAECETCANCSTDCGQCSQASCRCGDGVCDAFYCDEDCSGCSQDCGSCGAEDGGGDTPDVTGPGNNLYLCGNGVCEPGEDYTCADCFSVAHTCNQDCSNNCDCKQPWTGCGVGSRQVCTPLGCSACYAKNQYCCWCPADVCGNVTCVASGTPCPSC
jgi:hypothetical protein